MTHSAPQFVSGKHRQNGAIALSPRTASRTGIKDKTRKETLYPRLSLLRWVASVLPIQLGRHKACPYGSGLGDKGDDVGAAQGQAQGPPLPEWGGG